MNSSSSSTVRWICSHWSCTCSDCSSTVACRSCADAKRRCIVPFVVFTTWSFSLKFITTRSILTALSSDPPDVDSSCFWNLPHSPVNLSVIVAEVVYVSVTDFMLCFFCVEPLRQEGVRVFKCNPQRTRECPRLLSRSPSKFEDDFFASTSPRAKPLGRKISAMLQYPSSQLVLVWVELLSTSAISPTQLRSRRFDANFFKKPSLLVWSQLLVRRQSNRRLRLRL